MATSTADLRQTIAALSPDGPYLASVTWDAPAFLPDTTQPVMVPGHLRRSPRQFGGAALDVDPERALLRATGELQERMALRRPPQRRLRFATHAELDAPAIDATDVLPMVPGEGHHLPGVTEMQSWTRGAALAGGTPVWVSGEMIWPGLPKPAGGYSWDWTTIGTASAPTQAEAMQAAKREVIERDLLMRAWRGSCSRKPLSDAAVLSALPRAYRKLARDWTLQALGSQMVDEDEGLVVVAVAVFDHGERHASIGSGCSSDPGTAVIHAFSEALHSRVLSHYDLQRGSFGSPNESSPESFTERRRSVWAGSTTCLIDWLQHGSDGVSNGRPEGSRQYYAVDITTPEAEGLAIRVVRVVGTGVELMDERHACRAPLGGRSETDAPHPFS